MCYYGSEPMLTGVEIKGLEGTYTRISRIDYEISYGNEVTLYLLKSDQNPEIQVALYSNLTILMKNLTGGEYELKSKILCRRRQLNNREEIENKPYLTEEGYLKAYQEAMEKLNKMKESGVDPKSLEYILLEEDAHEYDYRYHTHFLLDF